MLFKLMSEEDNGHLVLIQCLHCQPQLIAMRMEVVVHSLLSCADDVLSGHQCGLYAHAQIIPRRSVVPDIWARDTGS